MKNIFDMKNTEDIPKSMLPQLGCIRYSTKTREMLSLFEIKNRLTIDEILLGIFRKYKRETTRIWVNGAPYNLTKRGILKKLKVGEYEIVKKIEDI